jgi:hypothetical protein
VNRRVHFFGENFMGTSHIAIVVTYCLKFIIAIRGRYPFISCVVNGKQQSIYSDMGFVCIASSLRVRA